MSLYRGQSHCIISVRYLHIAPLGSLYVRSFTHCQRVQLKGSDERLSTLDGGMKGKDHPNRGPKRKGDAVNAETKAPRMDGADKEAPLGETEQELQKQIRDLSKCLELSRQGASTVQQENQGLRDLLEQNKVKLAEETRKGVRKEQMIQSLFREIVELRAQFGLPAPAPPTVMAEQESQQLDWMASDSGEDDQLPFPATDF